MSEKRTQAPVTRKVIDEQVSPSEASAMMRELRALRATNPNGWGTQLDLSPTDMEAEQRDWLRRLGYRL